MTKKLSILILGLLALMLAGCVSADFRAVTEDSLMTGDYEGAAKEVEKKQESSYYKGKNSLLYYLDYGFLCHYAGLYEESNKALDEAERLSDELYTKSISREIGSYLINDRVKEYGFKVKSPRICASTRAFLSRLRPSATCAGRSRSPSSGGTASASATASGTQAIRPFTIPAGMLQSGVTATKPPTARTASI